MQKIKKGGDIMKEKKYSDKTEKQSLDFLTKMMLMNRKPSDVYNNTYRIKKNSKKK